MEEKPTPASPKPAAQHVIDVKSPKPATPPPADLAVKPAPASVASDLPTKDKASPAPTPPSTKKAAPQPTVAKKPRRQGVGLAIAATVIIVLGLAALATYAYLQGT
ncbi:MAG TPA: hypothetical protein VHA37_08310 [Candidatus Saccharimonadales bacterium]|nr:hypothetical protein [Candidatus Saccharimonadales bacterium]